MEVEYITQKVEELQIRREYILSIDIGLKHLALVLGEEKDDGVVIFYIKLIDISIYTHNTVSKENCKLYHTKTIADWISHVIQEERSIFDGAKYILIERQPIGSSFISIEQLIFYIYRDKTWLISPKSVHCHFNFQGLNYDQRKVASEIITRPLLSEQLNECLTSLERAHDICDAVLQFYYWHNQRKKEKQSQSLDKTPTNNCLADCLARMEKFRYNGPVIINKQI